MNTNPNAEIEHLLAERERLYERVAQCERDLALYRRFVEESCLLSMQIDRHGTITYANLAADRALGYVPAECMGRSLFDFLHSDDRVHAEEIYRKAIEQQERLVTFESRVVRRDGKVFNYLWIMTLHYDAGDVITATSIAQDVSAFHQLRDELQENRAMLQLVIDNLPQGVFWKDRESRFLGCNQRLLAEANLHSVNEIIGKTDFDMPWKDQAAIYQADDRAVMLHGPRLNTEERLAREDGSVIWLRTSKIPLQRDGEVIGVLGMFQDITEEKRQAEELRIFKLVIENAPDGIGIANPQLVLTYANPSFARMLGYPSLKGMLVPEIVHPDDLEHLEGIARQVLEGDVPHEMLRYVRSDGSLVPVQASALALRDTNGALIGYASINRDITEQLQTEESLRASEQRNRALLNGIPDLMFVLSADGFFLDYKADSSGILYVPPELFLNKKVTDVLPPELAGLTMTHLEALKRTREMQTYAYQLMLNDELRDFEARMVLSGDDVLVLSRDVTRQKRAERERQAMHEQIIQAQQVALRELSTPLVPIADGVVAMPIIGTIDTLRAQQIMETLLQGIAEHQARIAILDITGVRVVDTQVAGALIRAARASSLLGARVVLTGISPAIAQTLVHIGAELREMVTRPTLQEGIAYALKQHV
ncbi:MAG: PAS domain-containing protein [Chloroflexaceae bacterium]